MTLLKLLVVIIDQFQSNKFFFCNPISHIPYYLSQEETIRLDFNPTNICFEIYNRHEMRFGEFESVKILVNFGCIIDQLVIFKKGSNLEFLDFDVPITKPPAHRFTSFIVHNMSKEAILIPEDSLLGTLKIYSLTKNVIYKPMIILQREFDVCAKQQQLIKTYDTRKTLCEKLSALVNLKSNRIQDGQLADLTSVQEKQIFITSLIREVGIHDIFLPLDVKGKLKFDFQRMLANLNTILLSQYLQRSHNCLEKNDIIQIQQCDPVLYDIAHRVLKSDQINEKFVIRDQILLKYLLYMECKFIDFVYQ